MSLKKKTLQGLIWTFVDTFFVKGLFFVATIILARWLGPTEFGLVGMISVFIAIGKSLTDSGMSASLIRTKDPDESDFSTLFYMNMIMSLLIYLILYISAPYISDFYAQPILTKIIRYYCLIFIIIGFSAVQLAMLNKQMSFKRIVIVTAPSTIFGVIVGLILGYYDYGVWSIVWMYIALELCKSILLWLFSNWRPKLIFSIEKLKYHYKFGYKLMLSGLLDQIFTNAYNVVIGKYYSAQSLGYFERSRQFIQYPSAILTGIVSTVTYPMLSSIQDDDVKISLLYRKLMRLTFFITAPVMLGAASIAEPMFLLVLGDAWLPAVPIFQILSLAMMFYPIHAFNLNVLKVYGRSDLFLKLEVYKKIIIVISIIVGFQFGILGLVWSNVFISVVALLINTYYSSNLINYTTKQQLIDMLPILLLSGITFLLMYYILNLLNNYSNIVQIIVPSMAGIIFYIFVNYLYSKSPLHFTIDIIKNRKL